MNDLRTTGSASDDPELADRMNALVVSPPVGHAGSVKLFDRSGQQGHWSLELNETEVDRIAFTDSNRPGGVREIDMEQDQERGVVRINIPEELAGSLEEVFGETKEQCAFWREVERTLARYDEKRSITFPGRGRLDLNGRPALMGVLNVTPDSFSDGGEYTAVQEAVKRARELEEEGASIVDVGGESTRPGADPVSVQEETQRTVPVVKALSDRLSVPVSIDTRKPEVARRAIEAGAEMINDVGGLQREPELVKLADKQNVPVVAMHMQGTPKTMQNDPEYDDVLRDVASFLRSSKYHATRQGIAPAQVVLDPGIGFGKTLQHNLKLVKRAYQFRSLGCPILLGTSRKSFIGDVLDVPVDERVEGTAASVVGPALAGVDLFRVHDVKAIYRFLKMVWTIHADADWQEHLIVSNE